MIPRERRKRSLSLARENDYEMRVIGIPKTIDNDIVATDHCPGYGSVIKHISTVVREMACDHESMGQGDLVSILEVMGRNAGWIAAGASLAQRRDKPNDPPHLIYLPEVAFSTEKFLADVRRVLSRERYCMIVVGERTGRRSGQLRAYQFFLQRPPSATPSWGEPGNTCANSSNPSWG